MVDEHKVPLRTYIERLFDERTNTIINQLDLLNEKILRERSYLDEVMKLHGDMHKSEHEIASSNLSRFEDSISRRVSELARTTERMSNESHLFVRGDKVDERFMYLQEQIRKIEQNISELTQLVSADSSKRDANILFLGIGFTVVNVALNIVHFLK